MWPGQQPPGGEQNPQDQNQNPYAQPGYQQPNPYAQPGYQQPGHQQQPGYAQQPGYPQQPGYQQPNPYQQPSGQQYSVPGPPQPGGPGPSSDRKKTAVVAIVAATAVVAAAVITGAVVLSGKDKDGQDKADGKKPATSSSPSEQSPSPADNPRDGSSNAKPTIAGWKVVSNPKYGTLFDVPPAWEVAGTGVGSGFEDREKGDGSAVVMMSAPAFYKTKWCSVDSDKDGDLEDSGLGGTGTKGGQGATDTASTARSEAGTWVWAAYAQGEPKSIVKITKPVPYTTKSGLSGHVAMATAVGVKKPTKCDTDGKSIAFTFKNSQGDFSTWVLYASKGVKEEIPDATIKQILGTVRLADDSAS
ncbi:hypothetical protein ACFU5O_24325 [Streptomyces sp. NPDC057445]|uniref:hypothetical protein n=1 Tax=Streptomyces sp. NPDC057445 TaxID=3346136 RepID=UPI00369040C9